MSNLRVKHAMVGIALGLGLLAEPSAEAELLFNETFSDDTQFTSSSGLFSDGGFDYFGIAGTGTTDFGGGPDPSGLKAYTGFDGTFLTGMDLDGEGAALPVQVEWAGIDISGRSGLEFSGQFAEFFDAPGDIDFDDFVLVEYQIDGGGYQPLIEFRLDEGEPDNFNGIFREDTDGSGRGNGEALGDVAKLFITPIAGTGTSLDLRLSVRVNAGDEDFAVDNFQVNTTTPPQGLIEPFDNDSQFTTSSGLFSDGGFDFFGITGAGASDFGGGPDPSGAKAYGGFDGTFITGMDLDGEGASLPVTVDWTGIDISGLTDLEFSGLFAEFFDTPGDIDFDDFVLVEYQIDGGGYQTLIEFRLDEGEPDNFNGIFREDTDGSGRGDGETLGDIAKLFTKPIDGTGSLLDLRLSVRVNAGDEDFAVDEFMITGVPEPGTVALLAGGLLAGTGARRSRR